MKSLRTLTVALLMGACLLGLCGCESTDPGNAPDTNPGAEVPTSGDASLLVHIEGNYIVNMYLDDQFIGALQPGQSRTWHIPSGHHVAEGRSPEETHSPTSWEFDVAPGETEERWVRFEHR